MASLEAAIRAARNDPAEAQSLYRFLVYPWRAGSVERARCILAELGMKRCHTTTSSNPFP
jgi:hypothetical protein